MVDNGVVETHLVMGEWDCPGIYHPRGVVIGDHL